MLQPSLLTIYSLGGELHSIPLACKFTQIWPLPRGLILAVSQAAQITAQVNAENVYMLAPKYCRVQMRPEI